MSRIARFTPLLLAGWLALAATPAQGQVIDILHTFSGGTGDGQDPAGSLLLSGSTLYGTTAVGGGNSDGTVFQVGTNGTGYSATHSFAGLPNDGSNPNGSLVQSGSLFYGLTSGGGSANAGTMFQIGPNGTSYAVLHQFQGGATDGTGPYGSLIQSGSAFYGMTSQGGGANLGTVFKINADGTGYSLLHQFGGTPGDGQGPNGSLLQIGSTLYGTTVGGGSAGGGTVFKINTDGTGFTLLHSFGGGASDGALPDGSLIVSGSTLYGTTGVGGGANDGTVFEIGTDGTGFRLLHSFSGSPADGREPVADLVLSGSTLYGTTGRGGTADLGTIFDIGTDGTNFHVLHSFLGGATDGAGPGGDLILSGGNFYGTTEGGGSSNDGVVFAFSVPEPSSMLLVVCGGLAFFARRRLGKRPA